MAKVKDGDSVKVHYTGKIKDGEVFDSSVGRDPFEFKLGMKEVIPGFENAVVGLDVGDTVNVNISQEDGYGPRVEQMVQNVPVENLPEGIEVGIQVRGTGPQGEAIIATVTEINEGVDYTDGQGTVHPDKTVAKMDFNHPLAGKELEFEITVVEVEGVNTSGT